MRSALLEISDLIDKAVSFYRRCKEECLSFETNLLKEYDHDFGLFFQFECVKRFSKAVLISNQTFSGFR